MLTIIIPVYNVEAYLEDCLNSILSQNYNDYEVLLIDDGSVDKSGSLCDRYAQKDSRFHVFHKQNEGVSVARNVGLENAKGEWIIFADADDWYEEDAFSKMTSLTKSGANVYLFNSYVVRDERKKILDLKNEITCISFLPLKHTALWGYVFSASLLKNNHIRFIPGLAYSEDRVFLYTLTKYANSLTICPAIIYNYRINPSSVCASRNGIRIYQQHIMAAKCLLDLKATIASKTTSKLIEKEARHVIDIGSEMYIKTGFSYSEAVKLVKYGNQVLGHGFACMYSMISKLLTVSRRKIITFK